MRISRVTAKGQVTIPKKIRDAAHIRSGDMLSFEFDGNRLIARRITTPNDIELSALSDALSEWHSKEEEAAWHDL